MSVVHFGVGSFFAVFFSSKKLGAEGGGGLQGQRCSPSLGSTDFEVGL